MVLLNERLSAPQALAAGLITRVVPEADLPAATEVVLEKLATAPTRALGRARRLPLDSFSTTLETQLEQEARAIIQCAGDSDGREGVVAFLTKRAPQFIGQA